MEPIARAILVIFSRGLGPGVVQIYAGRYRYLELKTMRLLEYAIFYLSLMMSWILVMAIHGSRTGWTIRLDTYKVEGGWKSGNVSPSFDWDFQYIVEHPAHTQSPETQRRNEQKKK